MFVVIVRSNCVGIATTVIGVPVVVIVGLFIATLYFVGTRGEFGWDLISFAKNYPTISILLPLTLFVVGFLLGYRHFSRSLARNW